MSKKGKKKKEFAADTELRPYAELIRLFVETALSIDRHPEGAPIDMDEFPMATRVRLKELFARTRSYGMNIFTLPGEKVLFRGARNAGMEEEKETARAHLEEGGIYTVQTTFVNDYISYVLLKEKPGLVFNQIFFKSITH